MTNTVNPTGATALTFSFSTQTLRCIMRDGEPWFVASDACDALEIKDTSMAAGRLDDDERGTSTIGTPSGEQQMLIINESGLYSLILTSRKPEAKKFKKWVTSEVLPAIRKTGRYEAPQAAAAAPMPNLAESLTANDMQNVKRLIWCAIKGFGQKESWNQAIWYHLRGVLDWPSPRPWTVDHLPRLAQELARINTICCQVHDLERAIEIQTANRIFRHGEMAQKVIAELTKKAELEMASLNEERSKLPQYLLNADFPNLIGRKPAFVTWYANDEQPGLFAS